MRRSRQDAVEAIGWLGIVPIVLLLDPARAIAPASTPRLRVWRIVAIAFAIFALGPFLTVGGFDTGLKLPEILLRYVPFAANARMPGRAIVGVYHGARRAGRRCRCSARPAGCDRRRSSGC